jgi:hypothetical protein
MFQRHIFFNVYVNGKVFAGEILITINLCTLLYMLMPEIFKSAEKINEKRSVTILKEAVTLDTSWKMKAMPIEQCNLNNLNVTALELHC